MALTQTQKDLEYILGNKSGKNREEEELLKSIVELKPHDNDLMARVRYTDAKTKRDNRN